MFSHFRAIWVSDTKVQQHKRKLNERFSTAETIPGTRKHHCYQPININTFEYKITSSDEQKDTFTMKLPKKDLSKIK